MLAVPLAIVAASLGRRLHGGDGPPVRCALFLPGPNKKALRRREEC
jgi:hypothetical protein